MSTLYVDIVFFVVSTYTPYIYKNPKQNGYPLNVESVKSYLVCIQYIEKTEKVQNISYRTY